MHSIFYILIVAAVALAASFVIPRSTAAQQAMGDDAEAIEVFMRNVRGTGALGTFRSVCASGRSPENYIDQARIPEIVGGVCSASMMEHAASGDRYSIYSDLLHPQLRPLIQPDAVQDTIFNETQGDVYSLRITNINGELVWQREIPLGAAVDAGYVQVLENPANSNAAARSMAETPELVAEVRNACFFNQTPVDNEGNPAAYLCNIAGQATALVETQRASR